VGITAQSPSSSNGAPLGRQRCSLTHSLPPPPSQTVMTTSAMQPRPSLLGGLHLDRPQHSTLRPPLTMTSATQARPLPPGGLHPGRPRHSTLRPAATMTSATQPIPGTRLVSAQCSRSCHASLNHPRCAIKRFTKSLLRQSPILRTRMLMCSDAITTLQAGCAIFIGAFKLLTQSAALVSRFFLSFLCLFRNSVRLVRQSRQQWCVPRRSDGHRDFNRRDCACL
jgi:hypothetical protein